MMSVVINDSFFAGCNEPLGRFKRRLSPQLRGSGSAAAEANSIQFILVIPQECIPFIC